MFKNLKYAIIIIIMVLYVLHFSKGGCQISHEKNCFVRLLFYFITN